MDNDFLKEVGYYGVTARLKRLSDTLLYSAKDLYNSEELGIEPNWHLVFLILKKYKKRTMSQIAETFHLSQTAIIKIINKMKEKGYLEVLPDAQDKRKQQLQLSEKALKELPRLEKLWDAGHQSIVDLLADSPDFLESLEKLEQKVREANFKERTLENLKND